MDEKDFKKKLAEIYQEGYEAGEADMMKSLLDVIKAHENDDPKQVLSGIIFTCMKTIKDREAKINERGVHDSDAC